MIIKVFNFKDREEWVQKLQESPNEKWIKTRSLGGSKSSTYIPLFIQEALADLFFRECDIIEETYTLVVNEVLCTIKMSILPDYQDSEHRFITGTASKPIQQDQGSVASLFPSGKKTNALEYNSPAARAAAKSNALTSFANIFGRNLGREGANNNFSFIRKKIEEESDKKETEKTK